MSLYNKVRCSKCQKQFYVQEVAVADFDRCPDCLKGKKNGKKTGSKSKPIPRRKAEKLVDKSDSGDTEGREGSTECGS